MTVSDGATLKVGGNFPTNFTPALGANSTVEYDGTSAQTIYDVASPGYGHLIISNNSSKYTNSGLDIRGNLTINNTATLNGGTSLTHNLGGDWTNNGTFTQGTSTVTFNSTTAVQNIGGSASTTFYNLTNTNTNAAGLSIGINTTVANTLALNSTSNGKITTGVYTLIFTKSTPLTAITNSGAALGTAKHINGNLQFVFPNGTTTGLVYPLGTGSTYAPATLTITGAASSLAITGSTAVGAPMNENNPTTNASGIDQTKKVGNYWTLTKGSGSLTNYNVTFNYNDASVTKTGTPANYILRQFSTSWVSTNGAPAGNTITATGLTSFSEFEAGELACAAPAITSFTANACSGSASTITINGANYVDGGTSVTINGATATPVTFVNSGRITVPLPAGASGTGNIAVTTCSLSPADQHSR